jgi:hypothetical protein
MKTIRDLIQKTSEELNPYKRIEDLNNSIEAVERIGWVHLPSACHEADFKDFLNEYIVTATLVANTNNSDWINWVEHQSCIIRDPLYNSAFLYYLKARKNNLEQMILSDIVCYADDNSKKPDHPYFRFLSHQAFRILDQLTYGVSYSYWDKEYLNLKLKDLPESFPMLLQERVRIYLKKEEFDFDVVFIYQVLEIITGKLPDMCKWAKRKDFSSGYYQNDLDKKILIKY